MSTGYDLVEYGPEFKDRVLALQTHMLGPDIRPIRAYFDWKHERNPYFAAPVIILAVRNDAVIGMRTLMGSCWEAGRGLPPVVLPYADDFVVAPEYRRTGLAAAIMASVTERALTMAAPYIINLSAGTVTGLQSLAAGWRSAGPMLPIARLNRRLSPRAAGNREDASPFAALDFHASRPGVDAIVVSHRPRPEEMALLVERRGYDGRIRHVRDARFLTWRFQNPLHDYRFLFLVDESFTGYLVLRSSEGRVLLVDWEASDQSGLEALLRFAIAKGDFGEILAWEAAQSPGAAGILRHHGFQPVEMESRHHGFPAVLIRTTGSISQEWLLGERRVLEPGSWDMRLLYSMHG